MHGFPQADIHELLTSDLLYQVIKGTFKDHIIMWVNQFLVKTHREAHALEIMANIDHQYMVSHSLIESHFLRQIVFQLFLIFWDSGDSQMAMILRSGLEMILRLS